MGHLVLLAFFPAATLAIVCEEEWLHIKTLVVRLLRSMSSCLWMPSCVEIDVWPALQAAGEAARGMAGGTAGQKDAAEGRSVSPNAMGRTTHRG